MDEHPVFDRVLGPAALHLRAHTLGLRIVSQPEREVQQGHAIIEEGTTARLRAALPPSLIGAAMVVRASANAGELAELVAAQESGECLYVAAEAMIVRHRHLSPRTFGRIDDALGTARRERHRPLAQHVYARGDRAEHVRLVQMVGRRDDDRVESVGLEQVLDVRVRIGHLEAVRECARLRAIVVADREQPDAAHLRQHGKMRHLRDRAGADYADAEW